MNYYYNLNYYTIFDKNADTEKHMSRSFKNNNND
jgi:hypothetical protein